MNKPLIFVAGLGRCGSTLTMNMLASTGVPCLGEPPIYELESFKGSVPDDFIIKNQGKATKFLCPWAAPRVNPDLPWVMLWLDRDREQQNKSMVKFMTKAVGHTYTRREIRASKASMPGERRRSLLVASRAGKPLKTIRFEDLIEFPLSTACKIADFLAPFGYDLDAVVMATQVKPRSTDCRPDLATEHELTREARWLALPTGI